MSEEFGRVRKSSAVRDYNNITNNIDNNSNKTKTNIVEEKEEIYQDNDRTTVVAEKKESVCLLDSTSSSHRLKQFEVKNEAVEILTSRGMSEEEARERIKKVWAAFYDEAKKKDRAQIKNPRKFFAGWLANVALEKGGEDALPVGAEPTTLEGILEALVPQFEKVYPPQKEQMKSIVCLESLPPNTVDYLRGLEASHWAGISSPLGKVKSLILGYVQREIEMAKEDDKRELGNTVFRLRKRIAEKQWVIQQDRIRGAGEDWISKLEQEVAELEARLEQAKSKLAELTAA